MKYYCNHCKEHSCKRKVYTRKRDGAQCVVEYCINKGCGYKQLLRVVQVGKQVEFNF